MENCCNLQFFYKSNRPHFLKVYRRNKPNWDVGRIIEKPVNHSSLARDLKAFLVFCQHTAWVHYASKPLENAVYCLKINDNRSLIHQSRDSKKVCLDTQARRHDFSLDWWITFFFLRETRTIIIITQTFLLPWAGRETVPLKARSVIEEWNNSWHNPMNTSNPNNNRSYRSQGPVKIEQQDSE